MKQSGSVRIMAVTALIAAAIIAAKTLMPTIPLVTTVMSAAMGLVLIFSLYRSDLRRARASGAREAADGGQGEAEALPLDGDAIRRRLEGRPVPQISPGPLTRAVADDARRARLLPTAPYDPPVLELVTVIDEPPVLELTDVIAAPGGVARGY